MESGESAHETDRGVGETRAGSVGVPGVEAIA